MAEDDPGTAEAGEPRWKKLARWGFTSCGLALLAMIGINAWVVGSTRALIFDNPDALAGYNVALVLGTSPYTHLGHPNRLFSQRIQTAVELYDAGGVRHFLISGANPDRQYNEPRKMYQALRRYAIPEKAMTLDFAGFRTLDSIIRAHAVFGLHRFVIISQRFHDYRALFIAQHRDLDAVAYIRPGADRRQTLRTQAREYLARVKAVLDLYVLHSRPRFLGVKQPILLNPIPRAYRQPQV